MDSVRALFYGYDEVYEVLRRRAKRNMRTLKGELRYIVIESLREELEALRAERAAEQAEQLQEVM
jgi:hypothetical protein